MPLVETSSCPNNLACDTNRALQQQVLMPLQDGLYSVIYLFKPFMHDSLTAQQDSCSLVCELVTQANPT